MKQGLGLLNNLITLALMMPVLACAQLRVAVFPEPVQGASPLTTLLSTLPDVDRVEEPEKANLLLTSSRDELSNACALRKPVILLDTLLIDIPPHEHCKIIRIPISADLEHQVEIIEMLLPGVKRVGVLYTGSSAPLLPALRQQLQSRQLFLVARKAEQPEHLGAALAELMSDSDMLLALPDLGIFNASNARQLLMTAYRKGKPVIGPDDHWVRAGSLASAYIARDDLSLVLAELLEKLRKGEQVGASADVPESVLVNKHVAGAFDIVVPESLDSEGGGG